MQADGDAPVVGARFQEIAWPWLGRIRLWHVWLGWAALAVAYHYKGLWGLELSGPDDWMRFLEVRDFLAGQNWFDVRQYRMNPPVGADLQWSRLVDLPVAFFIVAFEPLFGRGVAERIAVFGVPLLELAIAMFIMERLLKRLGVVPVLRTASVALLPLYHMLAFNLFPGRIDHHGWQAVCILSATYFLVQFQSRRAAFIAGAIAALSLTISLEGLPIVAAMAATLGLAFAFWGVGGLAPFLTGLAGSVALLFLTARAPGNYLEVYCDAVSWPHIAAFAGSAAIAWAVQGFAAKFRPVSRLACLSALPLFAVPLVLGGLGACAVDPFAQLDPVVWKFWYLRVREGLPIYMQPVPEQIVLVGNGLLMIAGAWFGVRPIENENLRKSWILLFAVGLACWVLSLNVMRSGIFVQILMVPFLALLAAVLLPRARAITNPIKRILLTIIGVLIVLPLTPPLAGDVWANVTGDDRDSADVNSDFAGDQECDLRKLNRLEPGHLFASLNIGPPILGMTRHTVVASNYHRNGNKIRDVLDVFGGDPGYARRLVIANHADYLVFCDDYRGARTPLSHWPDSLIAQLQTGRVPNWLEPVTAIWDSHLRVYKVR
ncbi:hypothetical protein LK12_05775 [Novosphingobium malaysiense]|uniref:Glycosyltransferase RgtA/B/C/D-like domain-containing protein n=2 Tax=Novosphingobium malaysiense TaxID=1348853 RepID=A0A0B1ZMH5_9SPHN|nr:hypothetical protein LK12_05775 [Novosphingobium malaysiense]